GFVSHMRQDPGVPELRHRANASQACPQDGMSLLRIHRLRAREMRALRQRVRVLHRYRVRKTRRVVAWHVSYGAHRATRPRYGARQGRLRTYAGRTERTRTGSAGRYADDRKRTRCARRDAGWSGRGRCCLGAARFSRRRTYLSVADASCWAGGTRADAGQGGIANVLSGSLRGAIRSTARFPRLLRERAALSQLDALPALLRAGERAGA